MDEIFPMRSREFRNLAWNALGGNWLKAIFSVLFCCLISCLCVVVLSFLATEGSLVYDILDVLGSFFVGVFSFGLLALYLGIARKQETSFGTLFAGFSSLRLFCRIIFAEILTALPLFIAAIIVSFIYYGWMLGAEGLSLIFPVIVFALFLGFAVFWSYSMMPLFFVMRDHLEISAWAALKKSFGLMSGHRFRLFKLHLSFFGWCILGCVTAGILFFWIGPYMMTATAVFYDDLISKTSPAEKLEETQT